MRSKDLKVHLLPPLIAGGAEALHRMAHQPTSPFHLEQMFRVVVQASREIPLGVGEVEHRGPAATTLGRPLMAGEIEDQAIEADPDERAKPRSIRVVGG